MTDIALAKVEITIRRAAARYPFHVAILERFELLADSSVRTMGVQATGTGVRLLFDEQFVSKLPYDQLLGVLLHEVHHVLFRHILTDPRDYPDEWARIVAEEVTVNEFVREPLPKGGILLKDFPNLPPMESTQQRYARLKTQVVRFPIGSLGNAPASPSSTVKGPIDNHDVWSAGAGTTDTAAAAIQDLIDDAAIAAGLGNVPAELLSSVSLDGTELGRLRWQSLLRRYTGKIIQAQPRLDRPSRRLPQWVGVVPGLTRRGDRPRILAVIDTSGSVTPAMLTQISAELSRLAKDFEVIVVECDNAIRASYPYRPVTKINGRGGTDLRPPLAPKFLRQKRADLVVYFTDGFGPAPQSPPRVPVIWCLVPGGAAPARWGRVITMEMQSTNEKHRSLDENQWVEDGNSDLSC